MRSDRPRPEPPPAPRSRPRPTAWRVAAVAIALAVGRLAAAPPVLAAERGPTQRQALADLAYVLGESHALRQACLGQTDQFWRGRMYRLIDAETPDPALDRRLKESFNTGYAAAQAAFPACDEASRREAARIAQRGKDLTAALAP